MNKQYVLLNYLTFVYTNWHTFKVLSRQIDEKFLCLTEFLWFNFFSSNQKDFYKFSENS